MTKKILDAKIIRNEEIADQIYRIILQSEEPVIDAEPGQFVNVYLHDKSMLLPRPISICFTEHDQLTLIYKVMGNGTKALSGYTEGDNLSISTPLGHGYDLNAIFQSLSEEADTTNKIQGSNQNESTKTIALIAGGVGVPPMLELAKNIRGRLVKRNDTIRLIAVMGFQKEAFLIEELKEFCDEVYIATEDGSSGYQGNVLEMIEAQKIKADYFLSCGPKPMLAALAKYCEKNRKPFQVSLEERMGCGYGACVGCTCKTKEHHDGIVQIKQKKVCKDGPVFFGNEVAWDE